MSNDRYVSSSERYEQRNAVYFLPDKKFLITEKTLDRTGGQKKN